MDRRVRPVRPLGAAAIVLLLTIGAEARDPAQVRAFRQAHPCPATGQTMGACPGWVVDHIYPLCAGGEDRPANMVWQDRATSLVKDKLERDFCRCLKATNAERAPAPAFVENAGGADRAAWASPLASPPAPPTPSESYLRRYIGRCEAQKGFTVITVNTRDRLVLGCVKWGAPETIPLTEEDP